MKNNQQTVGFSVHTYSAQRGGTQPLEEKSQFSDVECSEHRHGARPGSRHASYCANGPLAYPVADDAKKKNSPAGEQHAPPKKMCNFYIIIYEYGIYVYVYVTRKYLNVPGTTVVVPS